MTREQACARSRVTNSQYTGAHLAGPGGEREVQLRVRKKKSYLIWPCDHKALAAVGGGSTLWGRYQDPEDEPKVPAPPCMPGLVSPLQLEQGDGLAAGSRYPPMLACGHTTAEPSLYACQGGKLRHTPVTMCHNESTLDDLARRAAQVNGGSCPDMLYAVTLVNSSRQRSRMFRMNRMRVPSLTAFPTVNASDKAATLAALESLGVPFITLHPSKPGSYGQLASQLTYIRALIHQHERQLPLMYVLEDDVMFVSAAQASRFAKAACVAALQMGSRFPGRAPTRLVTMGQLSEAFLTSLDGARFLLEMYCTHGIVNNKDYQNIVHDGVLKLAGQQQCKLFELVTPAGKGVIKHTGSDLDYTRLRNESRMRSEASGWCRAFMRGRHQRGPPRA